MLAALLRATGTGAPAARAGSPARLAPYRFLGVLAGLLVFAGMTASLAQANEPWWHLTSGTRPHESALHRDAGSGSAWAGRGAEGRGVGDGRVVHVVGWRKETLFGYFEFEVPYNAEAGEVQDLELEGYGAEHGKSPGSRGHPAVVTEAEPYVVTFKGERADQPMGLIKDFTFSLENGVGKGPVCTISQVTEGKAAIPAVGEGETRRDSQEPRRRAHDHRT